MIKFLVNLYRETIPYFIELKHIIDRLMEIEPFKTISVISTIVGTICLIPQIPKFIEKIRTWGRY